LIEVKEMSEIGYGKNRRRQMPPLFDLEREAEERERIRREAASREWHKNRLMYSGESADRIAIKAAVAGVISYACVEEVTSYDGFVHKDKLFGRKEDRQWHSRSVRRTVVEK
jgi:hypothetical protein